MATPTFVYPSNATINKIDQDLLPVLTLDDPAFKHFPLQEYPFASLVLWDQEDSFLGLMQLRGYNGPSPSTPVIGVSRYRMEPGVYGEHDPVDEFELTTRGKIGSFGVPVSIEDLVMRGHNKLLTRQINRQRQVIWSLLNDGVYNIVGKNGAILQQDAYTPQSFVSTTPWATKATATPLGDFRAVQVLHRGHSVTFGAQAKAYMTQVTFNNMIANTNANDLGGRRTTGLQTIEGLKDYNELAMKDNLPQVEIYDEGWVSDDGLKTFTPFIRDGYTIVIGKRLNGAAIGEFQLTMNASNPDRAAAPYAYVWDSAERDGRPPRRIEVHRGFNGGPAIKYPSAVVVMKVS